MDDLRADGTPKGPGFLGALRRPDGRVSTELSIGVEWDGEEHQIPTLVPTLTQEEIDTLLSLGEDEPIPQAIATKAAKHAQKRMKKGLSPFYEAEEDDMSNYWQKDPDKEEKKPRNMWDDFTTYHPDSVRTSYDTNMPGAIDYLQRVEAKVDREADPAADASLTARTTWLLNEGLKRSTPSDHPARTWDAQTAENYWGAGFWGPTSENYHAVHPRAQEAAVERSKWSVGGEILDMLRNAFNTGVIR